MLNLRAETEREVDIIFWWNVEIVKIASRFSGDEDEVIRQTGSFASAKDTMSTGGNIHTMWWQVEWRNS